MVRPRCLLCTVLLLLWVEFVYCVLLVPAHSWGENQYGQLAQGNTSVLASPVTVSFLDPDQGVVVRKVSVGYAATMVLADTPTETGLVFGWGRNNRGELGLDHTDWVGDNEAVNLTNSRAKLPTNVYAEEIVDVRTGNACACALSAVASVSKVLSI